MNIKNLVKAIVVNELTYSINYLANIKESSKYGFKETSRLQKFLAKKIKTLKEDLSDIEDCKPENIGKYIKKYI